MKVPPISKIYEAFSAIADNRITLKENSAIVTSSDYQREYQINWKDNRISSTDNATFWQGYPGYPVIATWILQNKFICNKKIISYFKGINWHELNTKNKRNYEKSLEEVLHKLAQEQKDIAEIQKEVKNIYNQIKELNMQIVRKIKE